MAENHSANGAQACGWLQTGKGDLRGSRWRPSLVSHCRWSRRSPARGRGAYSTPRGRGLEHRVRRAPGARVHQAEPPGHRRGLPPRWGALSIRRMGALLSVPVEPLVRGRHLIHSGPFRGPCPGPSFQRPSPRSPWRERFNRHLSRLAGSGDRVPLLAGRNFRGAPLEVGVRQQCSRSGQRTPTAAGVATSLTANGNPLSRARTTSMVLTIPTSLLSEFKTTKRCWFLLASSCTATRAASSS